MRGLRASWRSSARISGDPGLSRLIATFCPYSSPRLTVANWPSAISRPSRMSAAGMSLSGGRWAASSLIERRAGGVGIQVSCDRDRRILCGRPVCGCAVGSWRASSRSSSSWASCRMVDSRVARRGPSAAACGLMTPSPPRPATSSATSPAATAGGSREPHDPMFGSGSPQILRGMITLPDCDARSPQISIPESIVNYEREAI